MESATEMTDLELLGLLRQRLAERYAEDQKYRFLDALERLQIAESYLVKLPQMLGEPVKTRELTDEGLLWLLVERLAKRYARDMESGMLTTLQYLHLAAGALNPK